jgi:hypothetical protein
MLRTLSLLGVLSLLLLGGSFSKAAVSSVQVTCLPGLQGCIPRKGMQDSSTTGTSA